MTLQCLKMADVVCPRSLSRKVIIYIRQGRWGPIGTQGPLGHHPFLDTGNQYILDEVTSHTRGLPTFILSTWGYSVCKRLRVVTKSCFLPLQSKFPSLICKLSLSLMIIACNVQLDSGKGGYTVVYFMTSCLAMIIL